MSSPHPREIDHRTMKLIVGLMAISLAQITSWFAGSSQIDSISASYHAGGWARDFFVGFLFAISTFMIAYNGRDARERILGRIAAIAGMGVALFPCHCGDPKNELIPWVHGISAAVMFVVLAFFCWGFYRRAKAKGHPCALMRSKIYMLCLIVIILVITVLGIDGVTGEHLKEFVPRPTFYGENAGLIAFGISWITASLTLPGITTPDERFRLLKKAS